MFIIIVSHHYLMECIQRRRRHCLLQCQEWSLRQQERREREMKQVAAAAVVAVVWVCSLCQNTCSLFKIRDSHFLNKYIKNEHTERYLEGTLVHKENKFAFTLLHVSFTILVRSKCRPDSSAVFL